MRCAAGTWKNRPRSPKCWTQRRPCRFSDSKRSCRNTETFSCPCWRRRKEIEEDCCCARVSKDSLWIRRCTETSSTGQTPRLAQWHENCGDDNDCQDGCFFRSIRGACNFGRRANTCAGILGTMRGVLRLDLRGPSGTRGSSHPSGVGLESVRGFEEGSGRTYAAHARDCGPVRSPRPIRYQREHSRRSCLPSLVDPSVQGRSTAGRRRLSGG